MKYTGKYEKLQKAIQENAPVQGPKKPNAGFTKALTGHWLRIKRNFQQTNIQQLEKIRFLFSIGIVN